MTRDLTMGDVALEPSPSAPEPPRAPDWLLRIVLAAIVIVTVLAALYL